MNAIEAALHFDRLDHATVLRYIAQVHPEIFSDAVKDLEPNTPPPRPNNMPPNVYDFIRSGHKVSAVKAYRETYNTDLKTALEYVDAHWEKVRGHK